MSKGRLRTAMQGRMRASATLEAVLVIPLYVYAVLAVMFVLRLLNVYIDVDRAAYNTVRELAKYAYVYEEKGNLSILKGQLYTAFMSDIGLSYGKEAFVVGGSAGFVLAGSQICENNSELVVKVDYVVKNPFDIFGLGIIPVSQSVSAEAWLGADKSGDWDTSGEGEDDEKVYVTEWGTVYHTNPDCSAIKIDIEDVSYSSVGSRRNASGAKYYACESCGSNPGGTVYITEYGDRYHTDRDCHGLKRTVEEVSKKQVNGMHECSRCKGGK